VLLLALAAVAVQQLAVVAAAEEAEPLDQPKVSFGRKLLQPFTLALQPITRVTSNAGRVSEKRIIANNNDVVAPQASGGSLIDSEYHKMRACTAATGTQQDSSSSKHQSVRPVNVAAWFWFQV
jgi:hypothetical protein